VERQLSLHYPLTKEAGQRGSWERAAMEMEACYIVNTSRGRVVGQAALEAALKSGKLAGVALDVIPVESAPQREDVISDIFSV